MEAASSEDQLTKIGKTYLFIVLDLVFLFFAVTLTKRHSLIGLSILRFVWAQLTSSLSWRSLGKMLKMLALSKLIVLIFKRLFCFQIHVYSE